MGPVSNVEFSKDGRRLVSHSSDRTIRIWDATPVKDEQVKARQHIVDSAGPSQRAFSGWWWPGEKEYEAGIDTKVQHGGRASGFIKSATAGQQAFSGMVQTIRADEYRGKRVRLSAFFKSEQIEESAHVWMRIDGKNRSLGFDNISDRPITGTSDWHQRTIVLDVPADSVNIAFGYFLAGKGQVWADDFQVEVVGSDVTTTRPPEEGELREGENTPSSRVKPLNLDFEC
jgi:hypothetical protein